MSSVSDLIAAWREQDAPVAVLARDLAGRLHDTPALPYDPSALIDRVDTEGAELAGTWQEVRAAHDFGELTDEEYDELAALVATTERGRP